MGVCCSPTELLLNKVVCVVVNQILLKLFIVNKPLGSVKFRAVQWLKPKPQKDVLSVGDITSHRRARISTETQTFNLLARYARRDLNYPNYNRYTWFR